MIRVTVDQTLRAQLNGLGADIELCDENGQTLGHFLPQRQYVKLLCLVAESRCPYTEEQIQEFEKQTGGAPLAEVWKSLGQP